MKNRNKTIILLLIITILSDVNSSFKAIAEDEIKKTFFQDGAVESEVIYKDEKNQEGAIKYFYQNGELRGEANFVSGKKNGLAKTYFKEGQLSGEINYKLGKQDGTTKLYYKDGTLRAEQNYKNNKLEGITKQFNQFGELKYEKHYRNDKLTLLKEFTSDGKLLYEEAYDKKGNPKDKIFK